MTGARPNLFTIPASAPFLPTLIDALLSGRLVHDFRPADDPLALATATLYLPTRRACRLARDAFLQHAPHKAMILPRIVALGDIDEDEIAFAETAGELSEQALALPPALSGFERKMLLTRLILKWASDIRPEDGAPLVANNPASAFALADDLCRLIDDMATREVSWDALDELVPEGVDVYWQLTLRFLQIAREIWPHLLESRGTIEAAARRDLLIAAETARLEKDISGPVIAAGSTASMPSTANLLAAIAHLSKGAVVLPGLDTDLDEASWTLIGGNGKADADEIAPSFAHPQFALAGFLKRLNVTRDDVAVLGAPAKHGREALVSEALRPAVSTDLWRDRFAAQDFASKQSAALSHVTVIEAANPEEEALAIAIALRGVLEDQDKTAALVTPDRSLARRVLAALERWNVTADDSGGDALQDTPSGVFAILCARAALQGLEPVPLLALLKHVHLRLGEPAFTHHPAISALERALLRGPRPRAGTNGLAHALQMLRDSRDKLHRNDPRTSLSDLEMDGAEGLVKALRRAFAPLEGVAPRQTLATWAARHCDAISALSIDERGRVSAFAGADGQALASLFEDLTTDAATADFAIGAGDYIDFFRAALADRVIRRPGASGHRVRILGPLEARLQQADCIILGGLVEGVWPPDPRSDPWLSRPMRQQLGLDPPERRIGLSAHDFAQGLGAPQVILTYSAKREGAPAVVSRFVQRLGAVAGESWQTATQRGRRFVSFARSLDRPDAIRPTARPAPRPPRDTRPTYLTVTEIEHWLRDPYTIYAKHILQLRPLDLVDTPPGARDRGNVIHAALQDFTEQFATALPDDPLAALIAMGQKHFALLEDYPEARAFWWPRFLRIAQWFVSWETGRRRQLHKLHAEIRGEIEIPLGTRSLRLAARADRIEELSDGRFAILDYKTGRIPGDKEVAIGLAPQLTLEAAILRHGGFADIGPGTSVAELVYVGLKGGEPPGFADAVDFATGDPDAHAERALAKLQAVASRFEDESQPYHPLVLSMWKRRYGDYDHLARVKEWSATGGLDDAVLE